MKKYTKEDLVDFGKYLLSDIRTERISDNIYDEKLKEVYDADLKNWEDEKI